MSAVTPWDGVPVNPGVDGWACIPLSEQELCNIETYYPSMREFPAGPISVVLLQRLVLMARIALRTDADLRAASAAGFKAGVEAAAEEMGALWVKWPRPCRDEAAAHLRALPIPDAPALATALEKARQEGADAEREACVREAVVSGDRAPVGERPLAYAIAAALRVRKGGEGCKSSYGLCEAPA